MKIKFEIPHQLVEREKKALVDFHKWLVENQADEKDTELVSDMIIRLDDILMIVVAGEYNSGKTAFINALLGGNYLEMGVTPTTAEIQILRYGEKRAEKAISEGQSVIYLPQNILRDVTIVDTPGTNAVLREHEILTSDFIPRSDLVLFITSVDRPFTESERKFLATIKGWGKKIVIILNKKDIIETSQELKEIEEFIRSNSKKLLDIEPRIFLLSAREALKNKITDQSSTSDLQDIEEFVVQTLDSKEQVILKLLNPLGVMDRLSSKYQLNIEKKIESLQADIQLLNDIEHQLELFQEDMMRSFKFRYSEVDNALLTYEKRGLEFFEDTFRIGRIFDLFNKERIQAEYKKKVVKGLSVDIDQKVDDLIDWLIEEDLKQWQMITRKIEERAATYEERIIEDAGSSRVQFERQKIIQTVRRETQRVIDQFDKEDEAKRIAEDAQKAVATSAAVEAGALGLGAIITILATSASADLTGVLLAGVTATLGFFILPAKKKQLREIFLKNIEDLRKYLSTSLTEEFKKQVTTVVDNVQSTIGPYSRFIRSEHRNLKNAREKLQEFSVENTQMKRDIQEI